jgi:transposase
MLRINIEYFKSKPDNMPITTILLDSGYHIEKLTTELQKVYPEIMTKIGFEIAPKVSKEEKAEKGLSGFVVVSTRWVIERSNGWVERCKILVKNFERTLFNATAKLNLCFIRLMLIRIAKHEI